MAIMNEQMDKYLTRCLKNKRAMRMTVETIMDEYPDDYLAVMSIIMNNPKINFDKEQALMYSSANGYTSVVELVLGHNINVRACDNYALRSSACNGHTEIVALLLKCGATMDASMLKCSLSENHNEIVTLLLNQGGIYSETQETLFKTCISNGNREIMKVLLDKCANIDANAMLCLIISTPGATSERLEMAKLVMRGRDDTVIDVCALTLCIRVYNFEIFAYVLDKINLETLSEDIMSETVMSGDTRFLTLLLDKGINIKKYSGAILVASVKTNNIAMTQILIDNGADINYKTENPLHVSVRTGQTDMVKLLLNKGADHKIGNNYAIKKACELAYVEIVRALLIAGVNLHTDNGACLRYCIERYRNVVVGSINTLESHLKIAQLLLEYGAEVGANYKSYLRWIVIKDDQEMARLIISDNAACVAANISALKRSCKLGRMEMVIALLRTGVDVRAGNNACLKCCVEKNISSYDVYLKIACALLQHGANTEQFLCHAVENNKTAMVTLLLRYGCNINSDENLLKHAVTKGHLEMVKVLLGSGARVYAEDYAMLQHCLENNNFEMLELLIEAGINIDMHKKAALNICVTQSYVEPLKFLIENYTFGTYDINTAFCDAVSVKNITIVEALLGKNVDIDFDNGKALCTAVSNGQTEITRLLLDAGANLYVQCCRVFTLAYNNWGLCAILFDYCQETHYHYFREDILYHLLTGMNKKSARKIE